MSKNYKIRWTSPARADLFEIVDYISIDRPETANRILERLEKTVSGLRFSPMRGRVVPELEKVGYVLYRELIMKPWRIIYKIEGTAVYVMSVLDARRNVEDILMKKLLLSDKG